LNSPLNRDHTELDYFSCDTAFIGVEKADEILAGLWEQIDWWQEKIRLFGRLVQQPRLIAWFGEPGARYSYSGLQLQPLPWIPLLFELKSKLEQHLQSEFNSVLANAYRDGRDSMGWHSDNEPELGPDPLIASLSFGAERKFLIREKGRSGSRGIFLGHGSLLVMKAGCQQAFEHSVPKTRKPTGLRINLTFREIQDQLAP
jgi:alkylated DNA repair dioxygenase AlkB